MSMISLFTLAMEDSIGGMFRLRWRGEGVGGEKFERGSTLANHIGK
jgi:hypothetical protein